MARYLLEFILSFHDGSAEKVRNSLREFGEGLEITQLPQDDISSCRDFKINITTLDPTIIFDACGQLGRIKSVKVDEERSV